MKSLVVYDSMYGNTAKVAQAIGRGLPGPVAVKLAGDTAAKDLEGVSLLIVGSPTQGGRPTPAVKELLARIERGELKGVDYAAFDTRLSFRRSNFALRLLMRMVGYAAPRIGRSLRGKGGRQIATPEGFIVEDKEGPLAPGEEERATNWAKSLRTTVAAAA